MEYFSKIFINLCFLFCLKAQNISLIYKTLPIETEITNPERGFYKHTEVQSNGSFKSLSKASLKKFKQSNYSLILRVFYLESFLKTNISTSYLNGIKEDFEKIRNAGLKCIVRFAYSKYENATGSRDTSKNQTLEHISQLKPLLIDNSDIIAVLQAGFIGTWGEWHYTDNFGFPPNSSDFEKRKEVVDALLIALPPSRTIQLRTPLFKQKLYSLTPLTQQEAYSGSPKSRLGHHNDAFLASKNDLDTYKNIEKDYLYLEQDTKYLVMGGETCGLYKPRTNCATALDEMKKFHWSYLNIDYNKTVIDIFRSNGCFSVIQNKLGYRIELIESTFPQSTKVNSSISFQLKVNNTGFAAPFNLRKAYLVLKNNNSSYSFLLKTNPNFWLPGALLTVDELVNLNSVLSGSYELYLNLPDDSPSLKDRPDYSIRFANEDLWDPSTGYNNLLQTIEIENFF